jgi:hypothetical protein
MRKNYFIAAMLTLLLMSNTLVAKETTFKLKERFEKPQTKLKKIGRGVCKVENGALKSKNAYVCFGDLEWKDYELSFRARAPKGAEMVQIWAGFRAGNIYDRYVVGFRGGLQDDVYLMRLGYMGKEEFLGQRPLRFHPEVGNWYKLKVQVCGQRIRVFVGDEQLPYIDIVDKNSYVSPVGGVTLGGGWIETEFDDLEVKQLAANVLDGQSKKEFGKKLTEQQREAKRVAERANYKPVVVSGLTGARTDISLDGNWLFMPEYQQKEVKGAVGQDVDDSKWHVMSVPNFWNPSRIWLHGETMSTPNGPESKGVSDFYYLQETDRCENYSFEYSRVKYAWYRQWLELPEDVKGKEMTLTFDAISRIADIYINGQLAGSHIGMFGDIKIDGSKFLKPGKNVIVVRVASNVDQNSTGAGSDALDFFYASVRESEQKGAKVDMNSGDKKKQDDILKDLPHGFYGGNPAGIWQPVKLTISDPLKVEDVFIKPTMSSATFDLTIKNNDAKKRTFNVYTDIIDKQTGKKLYSQLSLKGQWFVGGENKVLTYTIDGLKPDLWAPAHPNLYDFKFRIVDDNNKEIDCLTETSGFRTFEVKDGLFYLNGHKFWLRGANHTPFALDPNNVKMADKFMNLLRDGNIEVTRTHNTPWNKLWMDAADRNGLGVSFEGTWAWLFIHSTPIPDRKLLEIWANEWLELQKKYRNHPSLLIWTVNNEMKFYDNDENLERAKEKFTIISDVVKRMRKIDPTRPVCFDSNYQEKGKEDKFGKDFMSNIDDGDIDDMHVYYNWYDYSLFKFFNGEFSQRFKLPHRPLISQEFSTGYANGETGHPVRSYQMIHENPLSLIGYDCYDYADPNNFLKVQGFITGELVECTRRSNPNASGMLHFGLLTWFKQVYDYKNITPWPSYYGLKRGSQPVLVSAELWGRNLYSGQKLQTRIYVVNDKIDGGNLDKSILNWSIVDPNGKTLGIGKDNIPAVEHYGRRYIEPNIIIPTVIGKKNVKLMLKLTENGKVVSENVYDLLVVNKDWNVGKVNAKVTILDNNDLNSQLDFLNVVYNKVQNVDQLLKADKKSLCIISGEMKLGDAEIQQLRNFQHNGGNLLLLNVKNLAKQLYPEHIKGFVDTWDMGDIAYMERNDMPVFDGIEPLELRYFNNNKREIPLVCKEVFSVNRNNNLTELTGHMRIHGYCDFKNPEQHQERVSEFRGFPMIQISDGKGKAIVSGMCVEKASTDPIAGKLLVNMVNNLLK